MIALCSPLVIWAYSFFFKYKIRGINKQRNREQVDKLFLFECVFLSVTLKCVCDGVTMPYVDQLKGKCFLWRLKKKKIPSNTVFKLQPGCFFFSPVPTFLEGRVDARSIRGDKVSKCASVALAPPPKSPASSSLKWLPATVWRAASVQKTLLFLFFLFL